MIKILIVDDHAVVRRGLRQIIQDNSDMLVAAEAATGAEALEQARRVQCDVALLDINLPDTSGLEILKQFKAVWPRLAVLILSVHHEGQYAVRMLKAGARGYLSKASVPEELVRAIRQVYHGGRYISPVLAETLAENLDRDPDQPPHAALSDREYQIFLRLAAGKTVGQIATELTLSVKTVSTYRTRLLQKLNLSNNAEMMRYALEQHLLD
jgi:two-component system, NarL family, invasion response regulator UvrY